MQKSLFSILFIAGLTCFALILVSIKPQQEELVPVVSESGFQMEEHPGSPVSQGSICLNYFNIESGSNAPEYLLTLSESKSPDGPWSICAHFDQNKLTAGSCADVMIRDGFFYQVKCANKSKERIHLSVSVSTLFGEQKSDTLQVAPRSVAVGVLSGKGNCGKVWVAENK